MSYDLFFLSHGEANAEQHWQHLLTRIPNALRVDGVTGIALAHQECAKRSRTRHFFVVDADNELCDFDYSYHVPDDDPPNYVHLWYTSNPVNHLEYGWGGIKLFPKQLLLTDRELHVDMTTSFDLKIIPKVASITRFNTSPFDTWRSAFRECVKLSAGRFAIDDALTGMRLNTWCTVGASATFGEYAIRGATAGRNYGCAHKDDLASLKKINDFAWLKHRFEGNDGNSS